MARRGHLLAVVAAATAVTFTSCGKTPERSEQTTVAADPGDTEKIELLQLFGDQAIKAMTGQTIAVCPDGPVGPGDTWHKKTSVSHGISVIIHETWTLKSRHNGVALLDLRSKVESNPNAPGFNVGIATVKSDLGGTRNGSVELDEATGCVLKSTIRQNLSGELKLGDGIQGAEGMAVPLTIEGSTTVERL